MSSHDQHNKSSSLKQLLIVIPGAILAITLIIALFAKSLSGSKPEAAESATTEAASKVEANIQPVATVELASADAGPHVDKSGEEVVKAVCSGCHGGGLMGSPKLGDSAAWAPRIAQGYDTLVKNAINGVRSMPAKGGNPALTDGEIANAVAFMANGAGASFKAPEPKAADAAPATEASPTAAAEASK